MSIKDLHNETIAYKVESCNSFVTLRKKIQSITKLLNEKEIINIECKMIVTYRSAN